MIESQYARLLKICGKLAKSKPGGKTQYDVFGKNKSKSKKRQFNCRFCLYKDGILQILVVDYRFFQCTENKMSP